MNMKLRKFKDDEVLKPLKKETAKTVKEFLDKHSEDLVECLNWMKNQEEHPLNKIVPFLHCRQIGIEANIIISMENPLKPGLVINPEFIVKDKKYITEGMQVSESFIKEGTEHIKRVFIAKRSERILLKYSEYTDENTPMTKGSDYYDGEYAVMLQEAIDFSNGKLITRFKEYFGGVEESDTVEGQIDE